VLLETLSLLVHADSKVGKSTLGSTCPPPLLILDAEGSTKFLNIRKTGWDPVAGPPPVYDGTWDAVIVVVRNYETMQLAYQWLNSGQHQFRSVVLDSISEIQRRLKKMLVGTEQMKMQHWGELLTRMDDLIRGYRDLTQHETNPLQVVMFIAETRQDQNGKWKPYMQGQIAVSLPYWMDVVGYLYVAEVPTSDPLVNARQRQLLVTPHAQFEAGERVQGRLGDIVYEPNVTSMLLAVYPHLAEVWAAQAQAAVA
jgi:hypothetical protein